MRPLVFKQIIANIYRIYFSINIAPRKFELEKTAKCLILAPHADDETIGCGGLIAKNPTQFDVYCLTNGFKGIPEPISYEEKIAIRKKEFFETMEKAGVNYYHFFEDIDDKRLIMRYDKFKTISLSDYDYIFIPNILDQHRDHKSVAIMLKELMKDRPYKKNVKIVMYEIWSTLAAPNIYIDIEDTITKKINLLQNYKSQIKSHDYIRAVEGLNAYRGLAPHLQYAEAYCMLDVNDFKRICKVYSI